MIIDFRKTSTMLKETAKVKIEEFMGYLQAKRVDEWTLEEKELRDVIVREFKAYQS